MINGVESFLYEEEHSTDEGKEVERGLNCVTYRYNGVCYQAEPNCLGGKREFEYKKSSRLSAMSFLRSLDKMERRDIDL